MRKQRIDSAEERNRVMAAAGKKITAPAHIALESEDLIFFDNVIAEFAKSEWTDHQLEIAAMLARTMADLDREQKTLRGEGFIAVRENGTTVENPRSRVVKSLTGDILSLRRSLALHARARGDNRDGADIRKREKQVEREFMNSVQDDEDLLIARPECH